MLVISCLSSERNHLKSDAIHRKAQHSDPVLLWAYVKPDNFLGNIPS